jgi:hypothetical protein
MAIRISENELSVASLCWSFYLAATAAFGDIRQVPTHIDRGNDVCACLNGSGDRPRKVPQTPDSSAGPPLGPPAFDLRGSPGILER